jgi:AraC-like DNA-binding protein
MHPTAVRGVELLRAHFVEHSFERHSHETYSIGVTFAGNQTFRCRGTSNTSHLGDVITFNPDEAHDGHGEDESGFAYAMLYVDPAVINEWVAETCRQTRTVYFPQALIRDRQAAGALAEAVEAARLPGEALRASTLIHKSLLNLFERHAGYRPAQVQETRSAGWLKRALDYFETHYASDVTVEAVADVAGVSRVHLTRAFMAVHGVPPHVHLNALRIRAAQRLLIAGSSVADVAIASGFADQSHFTRRFKGCIGITPKSWVKQMVGEHTSKQSILRDSDEP